MTTTEATRPPAKIAGVSAPSDSRSSTPDSLGLRPLEQCLPPFEQRLELVAGPAMCGEDVDVVPVLGEPALQLGDRALALGDLGLDALELRRPLGCGSRRALRRLGLLFRLLRDGRRDAARFP